jgi:hypothetical protein
VDDKRKYISTPVAARIFNLERTYAAKLAREAHDSGNPFPVRRGKSWEAPEEEWAKIFRPADKKIRKPRPVAVHKSSQEEEIEPDRGISCAKAAIKYGISPSWATRLARRAKKKGYKWPQKAGRHWVAPFERWMEIFEDEELRAWKKTKN